MEAVARSFAVTPGGARRLPDRILAAVHHAIDLGDMHTASQLLAVAEHVVAEWRGMDPASVRRGQEAVIAAHQRIWDIRAAQAPERRTALVADPTVFSSAWMNG